MEIIRLSVKIDKEINQTKIRVVGTVGKGALKIYITAKYGIQNKFWVSHYISILDNLGADYPLIKTVNIYILHTNKKIRSGFQLFQFLKDSKLARLFVNIWSVEAQPTESLQNGSPQQKSARE